MHSRVARVMLVAFLLAVGVGAGLQLNFLLGQARQLADDHRALLTQLARFDALLADLSAAEAAYVAPGQPDAPWLERATALINQLTSELNTIRTRMRGDESAPAVRSMTEAMAALVASDTSAREHLAQEQDLLAADVVFGESRTAIDTARAATAQSVRAQSMLFDAERASNQQRTLMIAAGAAGIWVIGFLVLMPRAGAVTVHTAEPSSSLSEITRVAKTEPQEPATGRATVDLGAAADLCTALSRVVTSAALPDMLARTAALVDASGIIVWLGDRDELHAVMSHGYNPRVIQQLGSIPRNADNATAEAWRTGELRTVAGDMMSNGAIVAPMFGPERCVGVLATEVRHGREHDGDTQAVTMMIAAQLATVVGAWPSAGQPRAAEA
jgi:hypothetical protein